MTPAQTNTRNRAFPTRTPNAKNTTTCLISLDYTAAQSQKNRSNRLALGSVSLYYLTVPRPKTINSRVTSAILISSLRLIRGQLAAPSEVCYVDPDMGSNNSTRWFECPNYSDCLDVAARSKWLGWTCSRCQIYNSLPPLKYKQKRR